MPEAEMVDGETLEELEQKRGRGQNNDQTWASGGDISGYTGKEDRSVALEAMQLDEWWI